MVVFKNKHRIKIGYKTTINIFSVLSAGRKGGNITIGKRVIIGPHFVATAREHVHHDSDVFISKQGIIQGDIVIEDDAWIGAHVTVLYGSFVPKGCVIGANSVVDRHTKLEPYGVYAGVPLKKISQRIPGGKNDRGRKE